MAAYREEPERLPLVSILLPVYNCETYIGEAIESLLSQTYRNFELIIIDDGSTDCTAAILNKYSDPRIRPYQQPNKGLAFALNRAVQLAEGEYIARQDADDRSLPQRVERQVAFLEANPAVGVVGTWAEIWKEGKRTKRIHKHPANNAVLKFNLLFDNYFVHSSVMIRKTVFDKVGLYSTEKERQPEDYELWSRIVRDEGFKVANIPEVLLIYREVASSICRTGINPFVDRVLKMSIENLSWASGRGVDSPLIADISALTHNSKGRLSARPDFLAMLSVLYESAIKVSGISDLGIPLKKQVRMRYRRIRNNYIRYCFKAMVRKTIRPFSMFFRAKIDG